MSSSLERKSAPLIGIALVALLGGCLERTETIRIEGSGAVSIRHVIEGDLDDLGSDDPTLPRPPIFELRRIAKKKAKDGRPQGVLEARARFASAADVPSIFGDPSDPLASADLVFTTRVDIRTEGGKKHYHFERIYRARNWAPYTHLWNRAFPPGLREEMERKADFAKLSPRDRRRAKRALVAYEREKVCYWIDQAIARSQGGHRDAGRIRLQVTTRLRSWFRKQLTLQKVDEILALAPEKIDQACVAILEAALARGVEDACRELGLDEAGRRAIRDALAWMRRDHDVSDDLRDEDFVVRVKLPGRVIAHDGDRVRRGLIEWKFDGKSLDGRDHRLVAISVEE